MFILGSCFIGIVFQGLPLFAKPQGLTEKGEDIWKINTRLDSLEAELRIIHVYLTHSIFAWILDDISKQRLALCHS